MPVATLWAIVALLATLRDMVRRTRIDWLGR